MAAWSELQMRDRLMDNFIDHDPLDITLHRPTYAATSAGGRSRMGEDTLQAQRFGLYPFKRRLTLEYTHNPQTFGEEKVELITWILIWRRGTDIQVDDEMTVPTDVDTDRLQPGLYIVTFLSARLWDRGQAGLLYRG